MREFSSILTLLNALIALSKQEDKREPLESDHEEEDSNINTICLEESDDLRKT